MLTLMKTNMSLPYLDRLSSERQAIFHKLTAFAQDFTLAGGTAIMLQIGHRESYDFDCFCQKDIPMNILRKTKRVFGQKTTVILKTAEMLFVMTPEAVEINFVWYPYRSLKQSMRTPSLRISHLDDLVSNKAFTLGRRPQWRDYVDLFFLTKWGLYDLKKIIALSEKKFGGEFNAKLFVHQLTYFDDVQILPTVFLKESYTPEEIKEFLDREVRAYLKTVLP